MYWKVISQPKIDPSTKIYNTYSNNLSLQQFIDNIQNIRQKNHYFVEHEPTLLEIILNIQERPEILNFINNVDVTNRDFMMYSINELNNLYLCIKNRQHIKLNNPIISNNIDIFENIVKFLINIKTNNK